MLDLPKFECNHLVCDILGAFTFEYYINKKNTM